MPRRGPVCGARWTAVPRGRVCWRSTCAAAASISRCGPIDQKTCCSHRAGRTNKPPCIAFLAPPIDPTRTSCCVEPDMGRTSLAIAPSNPNVIYALAASNVQGPQGIYRQGLLAVYRSNLRRPARYVANARQQQRPDVPQHPAADQHLERGAARLQSAGLHRDTGDDGVVQQRDRRRSARSQSRLGRRRRLVPVR